MKNNKTLKTSTLYGLASAAVWIGALALGAICFVGASEAARTAVQDGTFLQQVFGAPLFEGFRRDGKFGVRPQWGLILLVVAPLCATIFFTALQIRRFIKGDRA